jgi:hypothetical protein
VYSERTFFRIVPHILWNLLGLIFILWHADPLLGSGPQTAAVWYFISWPLSSRGTVFSVQSVPKCFKQDNRRKQRTALSEEWLSESEWPVVVRPLLSSKRKPHFKTRKSRERTKMWSWVPRGPGIKNNCAGTENWGHCWDPLPGNYWWRHSRLRRLSTCSEVLSGRISYSATVACSYDL